MRCVASNVFGSNIAEFIRGGGYVPPKPLLDLRWRHPRLQTSSNNESFYVAYFKAT